MNEIKVNYPADSTLFAVVFNDQSYIWNVNSSSWQALVMANWQQFQIPLYSQPMPTMYWGSFPTAITTSGIYTVQVYDAADPVPTALARFTGTIGWDGLEEVSIDSLNGSGGVPAAEGWTAGEMAQIRSALGVDGTKTPAAGGDIQTAMRRAFAMMVSTFGVKTESDLAQLQQVLTATD